MDTLSFAKNPVFLAPMAGVTDLAFRRLCASCGAGFTYTEMVSAKGLRHGSRKTAALTGVSEEEGRAGLQLFGSDPDTMARIASSACTMERIALIDINMGCPTQKIVRNGEGCALMRDPSRAGRIIEAVRKASSLPVTVKIRKGWDDDSVNAVEFARMAEDAGAHAVTVHGRTRMQLYGGKADWDIIAQVRESVRIPVIGNGDVFCAADALDMLSRTRCAAVMVARGALGAPYLFRDILLALEGKPAPPAGPEERVRLALRHLAYAVEDKGEKAAVREFRKHAAHYVKGIRNAARFREQAARAETVRAMQALLTSAFE